MPSGKPTGAVLADDHHGAPGPGGSSELGRDGEVIVGADGTVYIERVRATSTTTSVHEIVAVRSTGTTAWTATLDATRDRVVLSGTNLLVISETTVTGASSPTSKVTALSTASGAVAWTLAVDGSVGFAEPFSGGTYLIVSKPATSTTAVTRNLVAISSSGAILWTVSLV